MMKQRRELKAFSLQLKAFTLMEVLVVMALTGLVVLLGMSTTRYFLMLYRDMEKTALIQQNIAMLQARLGHDMESAHVVHWTNELELLIDDRTIKYSFRKDAILRIDSNVIDTIRMVYQEQVVAFSTTNSELVNRISITCFNKEVPFTIDVFKDYPVGITLDAAKF